jgi:WD40 repeat protein
MPLRRGSTDEPLQLNRVVGLTTCHSCSITSSASIEGYVYAAGCIAVHYSPRENSQIAFYPASKPISCLTISKDGRYLATGERGHQPSIIIWNILKHEKVVTLTGHKNGVGCLAFSPNGRYLVSVGFKPDKQLILWDWETERKLSTQRIGNKVYSINFHYTGDYFVTSGDRHLKWWYITEVLDGEAVGLEGKPAGIVEEHKNSIFVEVICGFGGTTEGKTFCTTSQGILCIFNEERMIEKWVQLETSTAYSMELLFPTSSSSSKDTGTTAAGLLLVGCANGAVRAFTPSTLEYIATLPRPVSLEGSDEGGDHSMNIDASVTLDTIGRYAACYALRQVHGTKSDPIPKLVVVYADRSMIVWDLTDLFNVKIHRSFLSHRSCIWDIQSIERLTLHESMKQELDNGSSPSSSSGSRFPQGTFVTCSADNTIRFWNMNDEKDGNSRAGKNRPTNAMNISQQQKRSLLSNPSGPFSQQYYSQFSTEMINCIDYSRSSSADDHAYNKSINDSSLLNESHATMTSTATAFSATHHLTSPTGATAGGGGNDFDYSKGVPDLEIPDRPQSSFSPRTIAIHPFGHQLICGDKTGKLKIFDLKSLKCIHSIQAHSAEILTLSFSPPLITFDHGKTWIMYSVEDHHSSSSSSTNDDLASSAFSPSHPVSVKDLLVLLATAGRDRLIHIFNANDHSSSLASISESLDGSFASNNSATSSFYTPIDTLDHHSSSVTLVKFTYDGKRFISVGGDKTMVLNAVNGKSITKLKTIQTSTGTINGLTVEISNKFIITSGQDKKISIWNINDGKLMRAYKLAPPSSGLGGGQIGSSITSSELYKIDIDPSGIDSLFSDRSLVFLDFPSYSRSSIHFLLRLLSRYL